MKKLLISCGIVLLLTFSLFGQLTPKDVGSDNTRIYVKQTMPLMYAQIAQKAEKEWPSDFTMQKFVIEKQSTAFIDFIILCKNVTVPKEVWDKIFINSLTQWCQGSIFKCQKEYENRTGDNKDEILCCLNGDWIMITHTMNMQIQAYKNLQQ